MAMPAVPAASYVGAIRLTEPRSLPMLLGNKSRDRMERDRSCTPHGRPTPAAAAAFRLAEQAGKSPGLRATTSSPGRAR
jgi:hypothetical protein